MKKVSRVLPFVVLPLLSLPMVGCGGGKSAKDGGGAAESAVALAVRAHTASNRVFERRLTVQGVFEAKRFANVAPRVGGNLDAVFVEEGDSVVAGETRLFQVDPVGLSNACVIAEQGLDVARAGLSVAEANADKVRAESAKVALDFGRYERLHRDGKVSDNEYETMETASKQAAAGIAVADAQVELARRQVEQAEASLAIARKNLDDSLIFAPLSGVVSRRMAEPGEQATVGAPVLQIVDPGMIEARAFLPAQYYGNVVAGETEFRLARGHGEGSLHKIGYRSPTISTVLRTFEIKGAVGPASGGAVPGGTAELMIVFEAREGLGVPMDALLKRGGMDVVFVVEDGKAVRKQVEVGLSNDTCVEILSGLEADELVIVEGQTLVRAGQRVEVL